MDAKPSSEDLIIAAAVVFLALVGFVAMLYLSKKDGKGRKAGGSYTPVRAIPEGGVGTVYVQEGNQVVRRSTRHAGTPLAQRPPGAAEDVTPVARTPRTVERTTGRRTAAKSPAPTTPRSARGRPSRA